MLGTKQYIELPRFYKWVNRFLFGISNALVFGAYSFPVFLYGFAVRAYFKLGHWPRVSLDDPKFIGLDFWYDLATFGVWYGSLFWYVALYFCVAHILVNLPRLRWRFVIFWFFSLALMALVGYNDPGRFIEWYFD